MTMSLLPKIADFNLAFVTKEGKKVRLGVGYVPEGAEARQEFQGPLVPGPWAFTFGLATVISAQRFPDEPLTYTVREGDLVEVDGHLYRLEAPQKGYPQSSDPDLTPVD